VPQQQAGLSLSRRRTIWWLRGLSLLITLVLWEWYGRHTNPILFTYPTAIAGATVDMMADGTLLKALGQSMQVLAIGFALGTLSGVALGLLAGRASWPRLCWISPWRHLCHPHGRPRADPRAVVWVRPLAKSWSSCCLRCFRC
jgi:ABC-type nitrate/sulfonate/bicarbonate transport system permease component